jgi:cytidine deaminase
VNQGQRDQLIAGAKLGMKNAYAVVSSFPVGAAVLTSKGNVFQGCNTESVISGMGVCAERSAIDHAVACGEYLF